MSNDAMQIIRNDLVTRIDGIAAAAGRMSLSALCEQMHAIRRVARQHSMDAVDGLASMLESAAAYHGHGPVILSYLDLMRDAVDSKAQGPQAATAYRAALSLRMGHH